MAHIITSVTEIEIVTLTDISNAILTSSVRDLIYEPITLYINSWTYEQLICETTITYFRRI